MSAPEGTRRSSGGFEEERIILPTVALCSSGDAGDIRVLEELFSSVRWGSGVIERELAEPGLGVLYLGARLSRRLAGYAVLRADSDRLHLLNLVVHERYRRRGIASSLLLGAFELGGYLGCSNIRLVTQATNTGAIALYGEMGFSDVRRRGQYYRDGSDGIEMERSLKEEAQWWKSANASGRRRLFF